jgi:hypothetical protein
MMKSDLFSITFLLLLIAKVNVGQEAGADYSYDDDYEEIPKAPASTASVITTTSSTTVKSLIGASDDDDNSVFDEERRKMENDVIKTQLDTMSSTFRKIITRIKMKHKRIDMVITLW